MKRTILSLRAALILVLLTSAACGPSQSGEEQASTSVAAAAPDVITLSEAEMVRASIVTETATPEPFQSFRDFPGTIQANHNRLAELTALVRGRVTEVYVDVGQDVTKGQLLALLYSHELGVAQAAHLKSVARLWEARAAFERAENLYREDAGSRAVMQKREAEALTVGAEALESRARLELLGMGSPDIKRLIQTKQINSQVPVSAPFSGRLLSRHIVRGELVELGEKLFEVADLSSVWAIAHVPERDVWLINESLAVDIVLPSYPDRVFQGVIEHTADVLDPATRTMRVRIALPNPDRKLKPEMFAAMRMHLTQRDGSLHVASEAVQREGRETFVFVRTGLRQFVRRSVRLGDEIEDRVLILDGLRDQDEVATQGAFTLKALWTLQRQRGKHT